MSTQEHSVIIRIDGQLNSNISAAIRQAQNGLNNLGRGAIRAQSQISAQMQRFQAIQGQFSAQMQRLQAIQSQNSAIQTYQNLQRTISQTNPQLSQMRNRAAELQNQIQSQAAQVEQYRQALQRLRNARAEMNPRSTEYRVMGEQIRQASQELKNQERELRQTRQSYSSQMAQVNQLNAKLEAQKNKLRELHAALEAAGVSAQEMAQAESELQSQIESTNAAIERQAQVDSARNAHNAASQNLFNEFGNFQNSVSTAQNIMSPFVGAIQTAADFEQVMSKVGAISGATGADFEALRNIAQEMGASTAFSASQSAEALTYLAMAGWNSSQMVAGLPAMLNLAAAGGTDLARTADIVSDGLTAMGMSANMAGNFADVMTVAATNSNTSIELMGQTFQYAASVAGSLGYSIEDLALATGLMANAGIKGSNAGTALRSTFTRLIDPPKEAAVALENLGISATRSDGTVKPFRETLQDLRTAFAGLSDAEKATYASTIAGQEAMSGFLSMINASDSDFNDLQNAIDNSGGASERVAAQMQDNFNGALTSLKSALEGAAISLGTVFLPAVTTAARVAQSFASGFNTFVQNHPAIVQAAGAIAAATSGAIVAISGFNLASAGIEYLSTGFNLIKSQAVQAAASVRAFWAAQTAGSSSSAAVNALRNLASSFASVSRAAMGLVFSPVGAALMLLGASAYYVYTNWATLAPVFSGIAGILGGTLSAAFQSVQPAIASAGAAFSALMPSIQSLASLVGSVLVPAFIIFANSVVGVVSGAIGMVTNLISTVANVASGFMTAIRGAIEGDWNTFWQGLIDTVTNLFGGLADTVTAPFSAIGDTINNIGASFGLWDAQVSMQSAGGAAAAAVPVDTSETQAQLDAVSAAASENAMQTQASSMGLMEFINTATAANPPLQMVGETATTTSGNLQTLDAAALSAASSLSQIDSGASAVAGALSAKAAEISSIHISIPQFSVAANAQGGIYSQGAFLTTFAENSPEAAIPIDNSPRSIDLWKQTGVMLGQLPGSNFAPVQSGENPDGNLISFGSQIQLPAPQNQNSVSREIFSPQITIHISSENLRDTAAEIGNSLTRQLDSWWQNKIHDRQRRSFS